MEEKTHRFDDVLEAVSYANGNNALEDNELSLEDLEKLINDINEGKTDQSFLYSVVELVRKREEERKARGTGDAVYAKVRK